MIRVPWTPREDALVAQAADRKLSLDDLFDQLPHRAFKALRRRYVTCGWPDEETRSNRMMMFGSVALRRAILKERP